MHHWIGVFSLFRSHAPSNSALFWFGFDENDQKWPSRVKNVDFDDYDPKSWFSPRRPPLTRKTASSDSFEIGRGRSRGNRHFWPKTPFLMTLAWFSGVIWGSNLTIFGRFWHYIGDLWGVLVQNDVFDENDFYPSQIPYLNVKTVDFDQNMSLSGPSGTKI